MKAVSVALLAGSVGCALIQPVAAAQASTYKEKLLYSFCSQENCTDGEVPHAGLIDVHGLLYGTTGGGGAHSAGTVFSLDHTTGAESVVYSFAGGARDGDGPGAGLTDVKGKLYGTTTEGAGACSGFSYGCGTVFAVDRNTGEEKVLHYFAGSPDGRYPVAGLIDVDGELYGTTEFGGSSDVGAVFAVDPATRAEMVLYSFSNGTDGGYPLAGLINVNGALYGTTEGGGTYGAGTVFSLDPGTGTETVVYSFGGTTDGGYPAAGLIDADGVLYGTTAYGGGTGCEGYGCGTVFSLDPGTGAETVLYSFCSQKKCADGADPVAGLIDVGGVLYGTTNAGGAKFCSGGCGTVFSVDPTTDAETVLYSFLDSTGGAHPTAGVIDIHGKLYGTTTNYGADNAGTVFELKEERRQP